MKNRRKGFTCGRDRSERIWFVRRMMGRVGGMLLQGMLVLCGLAVCSPVALLLTGSITDSMELGQALSPIFYEGEGFLSWRLLPDYPTAASYGKLLFLSPQFFVLFWNSVKITGLILAGQMLVAVPAAWAFAVYPFRLRGVLFSLYVVLMLLPFQVTMLPSYLVLDRLGLMDTQAAVILPAVFSTFPVFLIYRGFAGIPVALLEAGRMDGAEEWQCFVYLGLPLGAPMILSALVLGFLDYWSMVEQPLCFIQNRSLWPLSLYLPQIGLKQSGFAFAASVITILPAVFLFLLGQDYLEQGITMSGLKE